VQITQFGFFLGGGREGVCGGGKMVETEEKYKSKRMFEESVLSKEVLRKEALGRAY
jgi:hypothetical protein